MDGRFVRVAIEGDHFYIKGKIFVPAGYRDRVSDIANNERRFLPVIVEEIKLIDKQIVNHFPLSALSQENKVLIINKDVIHFIVPLEGTKKDEGKPG
jgi:hypothetical protein